ncbi:MAG: glycosyltransferase family A protein [Desulforhopalus sp.]
MKMTLMTSEGVSVIIPVYNNSLYVGEAIESVLNQSFTDYEIIIVDDGSAEDIEGAVRQYLDKNNKIRFVRQENQGPGPARNTGIRMAKGKWIAFLDSDDIWCPDKLEKQIAYLKEHPDTLVSGGRQELDCRSGHPVLMDTVSHFENLISRADTLTYLLEIPYLCAPSSLVLSKKVLDDVGLFDESLTTVEDDDLVFRLVRKYSFYSVPDVVVYRRKHNENITTTLSLENRIRNKYKVTKKTLSLIDDSEINKNKKDILGYWTEEFARRHVYWKNYGHALKWILIGVVLYPRYYITRVGYKTKKILNYQH